MIIDIHAHIFPDELAHNALKQLSSSSKLKPFTNGTLNGTKNYQIRCDVSRFVCQNIAVTPKSQNKVNDFAIKTNSFETISFGSVHTLSSDWQNELIRLKQNNIKGIKFHCEYQNFYPDDDNALKIYEKCRELNLAIMFHGGEDLGFSPPFKATPERFLNAFKNVPYDKYIIAHMGGFNLYDDVVKHLADTSFNIDTSFALTRMSKEKAHYVIDAFKVERVLFGSDCPWDSPAENIAKINSLKYTATQKAMILSKNAIRLLNL